MLVSLDIKRLVTITHTRLTNCWVISLDETGSLEDLSWNRSLSQKTPLPRQSSPNWAHSDRAPHYSLAVHRRDSAPGHVKVCELGVASQEDDWQLVLK